LSAAFSRALKGITFHRKMSMEAAILGSRSPKVSIKVESYKEIENICR